MEDKLFIALIGLGLLTAPFALAEDGDPDENATWGLCTAQEASQPGDDASNGTLGSTPPFANTTDEECANATHPANGTPGEDHVPSDPGADEGDENRDDRAEDGEENASEGEDRANDGEENADEGDDGADDGEENREDDDRRP